MTAADWTLEDQYWRDRFRTLPYAAHETAYDMFQPAYRYGVEMYCRYPQCRFDALSEATLRQRWEHNHGKSGLTWDQAKSAVRDAYTRLYERHAEIA